MFTNDKFPKGYGTDSYKQSHGQYEGLLFNLNEEKKYARKLSVVSFLLNIVCVLTMVYVSMTANVKTYVVRVDNATGRVDVGGQLKATNYNPQIAEINYFLINFVSQIRTIPLDPVLYRNNWSHAQYFLIPAAAQKLNVLTAQENQVEKLGKYTTQIKIRSIQQSPGANNTFIVRWSEDVYNVSGQQLDERNFYNAIFTVLINPPSKEEEIINNPLGLKIADLSITKEAHQE